MAERKYRKTIKELLISNRKMNYFLKKKIEKEQVLEAFQRDVADNPRFVSHIQETAQKLQLPEEVVEAVVKHYLTYTMLILSKAHKAKERTKVVLYGYFEVEFVNPLINEFSHYSNIFLNQFKKRKR